MIILADIGNTATKIATTEEGEITSTAYLGTRRDRTPDEIYLDLKNLGIDAPADAVVCSVVPEVTPRFLAMLRDRLNVSEPLVVTPYIETGVQLSYRNLSNLGADRIANVVGAHYEYGKDMGVVDFGTAVTIDLVTAKGFYLGGIIAPGPKTGLANLLKASSKLLDVEPARPSRFVGRSTRECLESGLYLSVMGFVQAARAAIRRETKIDFTFIATGGLAERFAPLASSVGLVDKNLTFKGCLALYRLNRKGG